MGSGKTTLGKKLAKHFNYSFIDTDKLIEEADKMSISEIFRQKGEDYFRKKERILLNSLSLSEKAVISVGGGLPCFEDNMDILLQLGIVIYLERPPKELVQRVLPNIHQRPLLKNKNKEELLTYIEETLLEREVYYKKAHIIADRNNQTVAAITSLLSYFKNGH